MVLRNPFNRRRGDDDERTLEDLLRAATGDFDPQDPDAVAAIDPAEVVRWMEGQNLSVREREILNTFLEISGVTPPAPADLGEVVVAEGDLTEVSGDTDDLLKQLASGDPPTQVGSITPDATIKWLRENGGDLSQTERENVKNWLEFRAVGGQTEGPGAADAWREAFEMAKNLEEGGEPEPDEAVEATEESQQTLLQFARDEFERTGVVPSSAELAARARELDLPNIPDAIRGVESILSGEVEDDPEEGEVDLTGRFQTQLPEWALAQIASITGGPVTPDLERRIVEQWNFQHGGEFESIEEIAPFLETFSQDNQSIIQASVLDEFPRTGWLVDVPGQRPVAVAATLAENLRDNYGYDPSGITRLIRFAAMDGDSQVLPYDDPADNGLILASVMAGLGLADDLSRFEEEERGREARETELRRRAIESGNIRAIEAFERRGVGALTQERVARELSPEGRFGREVGLPSTAGRGLVQIAKQRIRFGLERYQNIGLAVIHAVDDELAERVNDTGGDIDKLTYEDELMLRNVINRTNGAVPEGWLDLLKGDPLSPLFNAAGRGAGGGGGGAARVRRLIDPVQAKQQFSDLYSALLLTDPSPDLENQFVQDLQKALDDAEEGMNFDASARILDFVRGTTRYQELYGNKPEGQGEEEYLSQFVGAGQNLLGTETPPPEAVAAGLRTGETQTTVGQIAAEQLAKPEQFRNSRFFGRLAEAANVFKAGT